MNLKAKEEKKEYFAPRMSVLDMGSNAVFLGCSGCNVNEDEGYDDEFGFNLNDGMNHHA